MQGGFEKVWEWRGVQIHWVGGREIQHVSPFSKLPAARHVRLSLTESECKEGCVEKTEVIFVMGQIADILLNQFCVFFV